MKIVHNVAAVANLLLVASVCLLVWLTATLSPSSYTVFLLLAQNSDLMTPVQVQTWQLGMSPHGFQLPPPSLSLSLSGDRLTPQGAWHDRFRCHLTTTWPLRHRHPPRALPPSFSLHSHPLSQTLSGDLLWCRHDRCRCHCASLRLCLVTSWLPVVCDMTGVDVTYEWTLVLLSPL